MTRWARTAARAICRCRRDRQGLSRGRRRRRVGRACGLGGHRVGVQTVSGVFRTCRKPDSGQHIPDKPDIFGGPDIPGHEDPREGPAGHARTGRTNRTNRNGRFQSRLCARIRAYTAQRGHSGGPITFQTRQVATRAVTLLLTREGAWVFRSWGKPLSAADVLPSDFAWGPCGRPRRRTLTLSRASRASTLQSALPGLPRCSLRSRRGGPSAGHRFPLARHYPWGPCGRPRRRTPTLSRASR